MPGAATLALAESVDGFYFFLGRMTRARRDPGGSLICTESYWVEGIKQ